ncbi:hypothetical protein SCP_0706360 [Sparassis crispa]|uniref:Nucleolar pre-ribosomal-associated protein 1 C-terminal domain-containing protein n=1 Tax=Sparassis crispa TaxID=139825 RepID=A0A401GTD9_9APHY|nr:hypothetical protein SCP_0706360 [Sparassis crispa]GBE85449.1 hypothetical protein SCP_0706360 [Sparassis crispa]
MPSRETFGRKQYASSKGSFKFANSSDIRGSLASQNESALIEALTALRNQLTIRECETRVSADDERLILAKSWLDGSPGAQDIFDIWEGSNSRQHTLLALVVAVLSSLVALLSSHYTYHVLAYPIMRTLLSPQCTQRLNSYLGGSHTELLLVTLKLFNSMSDFAGGRERRAVLDSFAWETKSLPKLLHMRRKGKIKDNVDILVRPDIRTLYILFILSFVDTSSSTAVKAAFIEQRRDILSSIFKGLSQDPYSLVRRVLEICWTGIWSDAKIRRTLKIGLFSEAVLAQLVRLYERLAPENGESDHVPADIAHHFLLAICTRPGVGLCFQDRGWYPRESDLDDSAPLETGDEARLGHKSSKIYNKVLANVLKVLKVNEDPRQQELALKVLAACPELVAGYWSSAALALEPRISSKWITNIAFFGSVVSLPVPHSTFLNDDGQLYRPVPPPLGAIIENIVPSGNMKVHLSRGLQSPSALVRHCSALALAKCLVKFQAVLDVFSAIEAALEEDSEGQWYERRTEVEREIRKRIPDFQVIVGFSQRLGDSSSFASSSAGNHSSTIGSSVSHSPKRSLLLESAQRLLWLYHRSLPSLVAEARFDVGKLLQAFQDDVSGSHSSACRGFDTLRRLHVLRLLRESEQFTWSSKTGSHSHLYTLLRIYVSTQKSVIKKALAFLFRQVFSYSVIFQHDPDEITLWLDALPRTRRSQGATTLDGVPLTDEGDGVALFLDACAQQCSSNPYQYLEDLQTLSAPHAQNQDDSSTFNAQESSKYPSPLLITVLEQFGLKLRAKALSPSDALTIMSFLRKLVIRLASKSSTLCFLERFVVNVEDVTGFLFQEPLSMSPIILAAIRREACLLRSGLSQLRHFSASIAPAPTPAVQEFLARVEHLSNPISPEEQETSAYELVDWLRLADFPMHSSEVARLIAAVERFHKGALRELFEYLEPNQQSLWSSVSVADHFVAWRDQLSFRILILHCDDGTLADPGCRQIMVESLSGDSLEIADVKRATCLVNHRMLASRDDDPVVQNLLLLLQSMMEYSRANLTSEDFTGLVQTYFTSEAFREYCSKPATVAIRQSISNLLDISLDSSKDDDRLVVREIAGLWSLTVKDASQDTTSDKMATALLWTRYLDSDEILALFDSLSDAVDITPDRITVIEHLLQAVSPILSANPGAAKSRLRRLIRLRDLLPHSTTLEAVLATVSHGSLPLCYDSRPVLHSNESTNTLSHFVAQAQARWLQRLDSDDGHIQVDNFLMMDNITDAAVEIVTSVIYRRRTAKTATLRWLHVAASGRCSPLHLDRIILALCDSTEHSDILNQAEIPTLASHLQYLVRTIAERTNTTGHIETCSTCAACITSMVKQWPSLLLELLAALRKACELPVSDKSYSYFLMIGRQLLNLPGREVANVVDVLVDYGLVRAVHYFSSNATGSDEAAEALVDLAVLTEFSSSVKAHLAEPVLAAVIQHCMSNKEALRFARLLVEIAPMKPVTVNRILQSIVQHPQLYTSCVVSTDDASPRTAVIDLLSVLFHLHPLNTCQPTHVEPLRRIYGGTLSESDTKLLSIFRLFEKTRKFSISALLSSWSSSPDIVPVNALEAVQSLDPNRVFKTCLSFPDRRRLFDDTAEGSDADNLLYDPVFVVLLFAQVMAEGPPTSALSWMQLFRTNVVSLLVRTLSAEDNHLRDVAMAQLAALFKCLQDADVQEKPHVDHILNMLKDLVSKPSGDNVPRIPAYTTLLLAHSLRAIFYPSNFIYPLTARFLLQRPELDAHDVPMLFGMIYSSSDQWKKERGWILRFLSDGMVGSEEWKVLKRRHTWDLLASLFQSEERDSNLRRGVLEVLANITCNARATTSLVLKGSLLSWIELQLRSTRPSEGIAWIRILENVVCVVNHQIIEASTYGEWRSILSRCALMVLESSSHTEGVFPAAIPLLLRLSLLPGPPSSHIRLLIARCLSWIKAIESEVEFPPSGRLTRSLSHAEHAQVPSAPHYSRGLFEKPVCSSLRIWGDAVETLWRVSMTLEEKTGEWDELTCRLLIWRSMAGEGSSVGEWARREVLRNLESPS